MPETSVKCFPYARWNTALKRPKGRNLIPKNPLGRMLIYVFLIQYDVFTFKRCLNAIRY